MMGDRFVSEERGTILAELRKRQNDAKEDVAALSKKQKVCLDRRPFLLACIFV